MLNDGEAFVLGDGTEVKVRPYTLKSQLRIEAAEAWQKASGGTPEEKIAAAQLLVFEALRRELPALKADDALDLLTKDQAESFMTVILRVNGFLDAKGEKPKGEGVSQ